ncbi:MAG TPA: hypothetical protein VFV50_15910, partial [Bdellovibrionales bacterium]|nr:hypothetical protein [Bdellovibrionales bacterium]
RPGEIRILIDSRALKYGLGRFRETLFHELGHLIFEFYMAKNSRAFARYLETLSATKDATLEPGSLERERLRLAELALGKAVSAGYHELVADVFRVTFLQEPGGQSSRDFRKMTSRVSERLAQDEHTILNPTRAYLWRRWLRSRLTDSEAGAQTLRALLEESARRMDELFDANSASFEAATAYRFDMALENQILIDRLERRKLNENQNRRTP